MRALAYTRFELVRTLRNVRLLVFSLGFPLVLYFVIAGPNRDESDFAGTGISFPLYFMVGLAGLGTMTALISTGARIASERTDGWTRQLRVTPLTAWAYLRAKLLTGYAMALLTITLLFARGGGAGRAPAGRALAGDDRADARRTPAVRRSRRALRALLTADTIGPATGGLVSVLALVSGNWFPIGDGIVGDIARFLPSYWLVRASHVALGGGAWTVTGWLIVGAWTIALAVLARAAYRRDTERV